MTLANQFIRPRQTGDPGNGGTFTLPYPPSVNNLYTTAHGKRVLTRRALEQAAGVSS